MAAGKSHSSTASDLTGFNAVVEAEQVARDRVDAARAEANAIRQNATAQERRIAHRTDQRLQAVHAAMQARIAQDKARMLDAFEQERRELATPPETADIEAAARRLALRLVGLARK